MAYQTALMVFDMQVDFIHPEGAYCRLGQLDAAPAVAIVPNVRLAMETAKATAIPVIATKFTVLTGLKGEAIGLGHVGQLRPFLKAEGFRQGSPGQQIIPELPRPDYEIEKTRFSAFYSSQLETLLKALGVRRLVMTGIATYGAVEGTARDAIIRDYEVLTLRDCVASFSLALNASALTNLAALGQVATLEEWRKELTIAD